MLNQHHNHMIVMKKRLDLMEYLYQNTMYVENLLLNNDQRNTVHHRSKFNQINFFLVHLRKHTLTEVK